MPYYTFDTQVVPGTTIRSQKYNSDHESIAASFGKVEDDIALRLAFPADFTGNPVLPSTLNNHAIMIDDNGDVGYYKLADIASAEFYAAKAEASNVESENWAKIAQGYTEQISHPVTLATDGRMTAAVPNYIIKHNGNFFFPPIADVKENQQFRITIAIGFKPSVIVDNDSTEVIKTKIGEFTEILLNVDIEYAFTLIDGKWEI